MPVVKVLNFYTTKDELGFCSNFYRAAFVADGVKYMTSEHYYQAQKAINEADAKRIIEAPSPKEAAKIGRSIPIKPNWDEIKVDVMRAALRYKFGQHPKLMEKLKATAPHILVEHTVGTPRPDPVWGDGKAGEGLNLLGHLLMELRNE